jgi:hypothetical protein
MFKEALKESELQKLKRDSTFASRKEQTPVKFRQSEDGETEKLFKRKRIDDLKLSSRSSKPPSDRGGVARELLRRRTGKSSCHFISAYLGWRVQELHARRKIASRDFPI